MWKLPLYPVELDIIYKSKLPSEWRGRLSHTSVCLAVFLLGFYSLWWPWLTHSLLHCRDLNSTRRKLLKLVQEVSSRASFELASQVRAGCPTHWKRRSVSEELCDLVLWISEDRGAQFVGSSLENGEHVFLCTELCLTVLQHILCGFQFSGIGTKHCDLLSQVIEITSNKFE